MMILHWATLAVLWLLGWQLKPVFLVTINNVVCERTFSASGKTYCITTEKGTNTSLTRASTLCATLGYMLVYFANENEWDQFNSALRLLNSSVETYWMRIGRRVQADHFKDLLLSTRLAWIPNNVVQEKTGVIGVAGSNQSFRFVLKSQSIFTKGNVCERPSSSPCLLSPAISTGHRYCEVFGRFTYERARQACKVLGDSYQLAEFTKEIDWTEFKTNFTDRVVNFLNMQYMHIALEKTTWEEETDIWEWTGTGERVYYGAWKLGHPVEGHACGIIDTHFFRSRDCNWDSNALCMLPGDSTFNVTRSGATPEVSTQPAQHALYSTEEPSTSTDIKVISGIQKPELSLLEQGGLMISHPDVPGMTLFAVHYSINKTVVGLSGGDWNFDITSKTGNEWIHTNEVEVSPGDTINFWIFIVRNKVGEQLTDQSWIASSPMVPTTTNPQLSHAATGTSIPATTNGPQATKRPSEATTKASGEIPASDTDINIGTTASLVTTNVKTAAVITTTTQSIAQGTEGIAGTQTATAQALQTDCHQLPVVRDVVVQMVTRSSYSYHCKEGFTFYDGTTSKTIYCSPEGTWTPEMTHCNMKECPSLERNTHLSLSTEDRYIGVTVTLTCHVGFKFSDGSHVRSIICLDTGDWSSQLEPCSPLLCHEGILYGDSREGRCEQTKKQRIGLTQSVSSCTSTDFLSPALSDCSADHCSPIPYFDHTTISSTTLTDFERSVFVKCDDGYRYPDGTKTKNITCTATQQWEPTHLPNCLVVTCPAVQKVHKAVANTTMAIWGTRVMFTCESGYWFSAHRTSRWLVSCLDTGEWSDRVHDCDGITCELPTLGYLVDSNATANWLNVNTVVNFKCPNGFKLQIGTHDTELLCHSDGNWHMPEWYLVNTPAWKTMFEIKYLRFGCMATTCPVIEINPNSDVSSINAAVGSVVTQTCHHGYITPNNESITITCGTDLTWNVTFLSCELVSCPKLPDIANAFWKGDVAVFGSTVNYTCDHGYQFPNAARTMSVNCAANGTWTGWALQEECTAVHCPPAPIVNNSRTSSLSTVYGSVVTYSCLHGYMMGHITVRSTTITCTHTGQWSHVPQDCQAIHCAAIPVWENLVVDKQSHVYNTVVNVSCSKGVFKSTNETSYQTSCMINGDWDPPIKMCEDSPEAEDILPTEAVNATPIGTLSIIIVSVVYGLIPLLDVVHNLASL